MTTDRVIAVRVPRDLHRAVRQRALDEDRAAAEVVRDALAAYLARAMPKTRADKVSA